MSQSAIPPTPQGTQGPSSPQSSPPVPLPQQAPRNENSQPQDEPSSNTTAASYDDLSRERSISDDMAQCKRDRDRYKSERNTCWDRCAKLEQELLSLEDKNHRLEQEARHYQKELKKREKEVVQLKEDMKRMHERERSRNEDLKAAEHDLTVAEMQHDKTKRLLKKKVDELDVIQAFTSRADQISGGDVVGLVKALNAEILQAAAFISEPKNCQSLQDQVSDQDVLKADEAVKSCLGKEIAESVRSLRDFRRQLPPDDSTAVQLALQIAMTGFCERMINAWSPHLDGNEWLNNIYERIRASENQTIAGRWRALTRGQIEDAKDPSFIIKHLIDRLADVSMAIGSQVRPHKFQERFQKHLAAIADNLVRIRIASGESITSMDVVPYSCSPGMGFRKDCMDDEYGSGNVKYVGKDAIVGTTGLGLMQYEKISDAAGQLKYQQTPLLKAKVVLMSALRE